MGWRKKPQPPATTGQAFTENELEERLRRGPRNGHHRLPQSRWDKQSPNDIIEINAHLHTVLWHGQLFNNMIAREIAQQMSIWWQNEYIFLDNKRKGKFYCGYTAPGTLDEKWRRPEIRLGMTAEQIGAWDKLFGLRTEPHIVESVTNKFFLHPESPLQLIPSWNFWRR